MKWLKRFWVRQVRDRVYNYSDIVSGDILWSEMNNAEKIVILQGHISDIHEEFKLMTKYLGEYAAPCDKCHFDIDGKFCFKCEGAKVVQNKTLCDWPWGE